MPLLVNAHAPPDEIIFSPFSTTCRSNHRLFQALHMRERKRILAGKCLCTHYSH